MANNEYVLTSLTVLLITIYICPNIYVRLIAVSGIVLTLYLVHKPDKAETNK